MIPNIFHPFLPADESFQDAAPRENPNRHRR
jgi:hypothetical protein